MIENKICNLNHFVLFFFFFLVTGFVSLYSANSDRLGAYSILTVLHSCKIIFFLCAYTYLVYQPYKG